jgi:hypothetical protein
LSGTRRIDDTTFNDNDGDAASVDDDAVVEKDCLCNLVDGFAAT